VWHAGGTPTVWGEYLRAAHVHGAEKARLNSRGRVLFHRRHSSGLPRITALAVFIPASALVAFIACLRAPQAWRLRVATGAAVWVGLLQGYAWRWPDAPD
jgi:hypothetical protein